MESSTPRLRPASKADSRESAVTLTALSSGIGLGTLRAAGTVGAKAPRLGRSEAQASKVGAWDQVSSRPHSKVVTPRVMSGPPTLISAHPLPSFETRRVRGPWWQRIQRLLVMLGIDLIFLLSSLLVAFVCVCAIAYFREGRPQSWVDLSPIVWATGLKPLRLGLGVMALYGLYIVGFGLITGTTIGLLLSSPPVSGSRPQTLRGPP